MISDNIAHINARIKVAAQTSGRNAHDVRLIAVSKRKPLAALQEALNGGQKDFGENYLQEAVAKIAAISGPAIFHFIGPLQSNKAKLAVSHFDYIHTVDRLKIAKSLAKHATDMGKTQKVLIQVNVGREGQKSGVLPEDTEELLNRMQEYPALEICGFMTMPPFAQEPEANRRYFSELRELGQGFQQQGLLAAQSPLELSMGMSGDYEVAIEEGATMIRVGTAIFGVRDEQG
ncbi:MAG: YggS family pyridoxal phosphate-dependent enzyme [Desulfobulbaceae bacterium]|jgi:pyridoxal phosphate enzyme (YggS family)|nr:YggS family pyridoxal phosphate-dependent enzyme [Desulfobulbaceae bacterium]